MSALDQAFIKAYAKEPPPAKAATNNAEATHAPAVAERFARAPLGHATSAQIENIYAAGTLYRLETPRAAEPVSVPPPHFAGRASRRLPLRYRLAQMEVVETAAPVLQHLPKPVVQPAAIASQPKRARKAQIPPLPQLTTSAGNEVEELPEEVVAVVNPAEVEAKAPVVVAEVVPLLALANAVEVRQRWDELLGDSPVVADSAFAVWPQQEDLAAAQASSLISLDLETMPEQPAAVTELVHERVMEAAVPEQSPAKSYRLDAAHAAVAGPHQPPQPSVEDLIKPAAEAPFATPSEAKIKDRPLVVTEEEAAELVGVAQAPAMAAAASAKTITTAPHHGQQLVPAWEVDRFHWPALCDKLLRDEQSYFAQAGEKIVAAVRDGLRSLAITGSRRGEGRTTLALCLARSAASAGLKVALVDADFARPQLAASLGLEIAGSWHEAALGKTTLSEAAIKSLDDNLTVLPLDVSTAAAPLSLADPRLTKTLREAASAFDLLVLDLGPTAAGDGSLFPENEAPPADAAIVVRDLRYCTPSESQAIGERLSLSGIEAVGIAENFVPQEKLVA